MPCPAVPRLTRSQWWIKRAVDVVGAAFMLILTAPVMILTAVVIGLSSSGPALVGETRLGACGKLFSCYKFRTVLMDLNPGAKPASEPRVTRVGRILRAMHIDELPQLFNVLAGEMSLIGPRPEWRHLAKVYRERFPAYELRFAAKPGIMGLAQIDCPEATEPEVKLHFDLKYIYNYSLGMDFQILARTVARVFFTSRPAQVKKSPTAPAAAPRRHGRLQDVAH
jgi:lipopolysaccharide/colanic/teichoic acid biosynthesis glycosyltransferase